MLIFYEVKVFGAHKGCAHCQVVLIMGVFTTTLDCSAERQCAAPSLYPQEWSLLRQRRAQHRLTCIPVRDAMRVWRRVEGLWLM